MRLFFDFILPGDNILGGKDCAIDELSTNSKWCLLGTGRPGTKKNDSFNTAIKWLILYKRLWIVL